MLMSQPPAPTLSVVAVQAAPSAVIVGDWQIRVSSPGSPETTLTVTPATRIRVTDEKYNTLTVYNEKAAPWQHGLKLRGVTTVETTAPDALDSATVRIKSGPGDTPLLAADTDYKLEPRWGTFGSIPGGKAAGVPVWADYEFGRGRIDSIVREASGKIVLRQGVPHISNPLPPEIAAGETRLFNLWIRARLEKLTDEAVFPITETAYPAAVGATPVAQSHLPKTWAKLNSGGRGTLHILAWGDSVTAGGQASDEAHHYQQQFLVRLRKRFPDAKIELTTVAWGGRTTAAFLAEPPGSEHNFQEKVLDARPDLVIMEFVNDAGLSAAQIEERYGMLLGRFREVGAEWAILTPHFVWGEWMGTGTAKVTHDPRPYVAGLRAFTTKRDSEPGLALADTSRHWEHLAAQGIPYQTLLVNSLNHPDDRGHAIFADALMELFGER